MVRGSDFGRIAMGWGGVCLALVAFGCATKLPPPPAYAVASGALVLTSEPQIDEIDCTAQNCIHWYRLDIPRKGSLRVSVEAFELPEKEESGFSLFSGGKKDATPVPFELAVADGLGAPLGSIEGMGYETRAFDVGVGRGSYLVSVRTSEEDGMFGYRLKHSFKAAPKPRRKPKPPPKPRFESKSAVILEFEGWGSDVEAVLIDLGSDHGMAKGMTGYFVVEGEHVGRIVVEQVYPEGSRAVVEGALDRPLGSDTSVEILVPLP